MPVSKKLLSSMIISLATLLPAVYSASSAAAEYPTRPLEIVAPANPGGGWDAMARTINRVLEIEKLYPQPMSVLNKPGGGGAVGMAYINMKKTDDYELVVFSPPLIINTINKTFSQSYTTLTPLAKLITDYQVFIVKADSPYKTFKDLMDAVKKNPVAVKFAGGSSPGSMDHLAFCKVAKMQGINAKDLSYVAFSGGGEALTTLLGGNVAFVSSGTGEVLTHIQAGTVRALAISSPERRGGILKDVPTLKESGINTTYEVWRGVFGTPGMSKEAQAYWASNIKKMVGTKTWKESLDKLEWVEAYADAGTFAKFLKEEEKTYLELMTDLGFAK
jgi:putative tricarboxylic transport membrane protein